MNYLRTAANAVVKCKPGLINPASGPKDPEKPTAALVFRSTFPLNNQYKSMGEIQLLWIGTKMPYPTCFRKVAIFAMDSFLNSGTMRQKNWDAIAGLDQRSCQPLTPDFQVALLNFRSRTTSTKPNSSFQLKDIVPSQALTKNYQNVLVAFQFVDVKNSSYVCGGK